MPERKKSRGAVIQTARRAAPTGGAARGGLWEAAGARRAPAHTVRAQHREQQAHGEGGSYESDSKRPGWWALALGSCVWGIRFQR